MLRVRNIISSGSIHPAAMQCKAGVSKWAIIPGLLTSPESIGKTWFSRNIALTFFLFIVGYRVQIRDFIEKSSVRGKKHVQILDHKIKTKIYPKL